MFCGCIRFQSKIKAVRNSPKPPSTLEEMETSEWASVDRSGAPSPPERQEMSIENAESLVTLKREVVMGPSVESRFQVLEKIDQANSIY